MEFKELVAKLVESHDRAVASALEERLLLSRQVEDASKSSQRPLN